MDFGQGAWVVENGKRRRTHLFRCVLSHSRKGYCEAVWRQTAESFIRGLENAFRHFGGVSATVVIDNLKAGVIFPMADSDSSNTTVGFMMVYHPITSS